MQPPPQALAVACVLLSDSPEPTGPNKHPLLPAADWNKTPGNSGNGSRHSPPSALNVETVSMPSALEFCISILLTVDSDRTSLPPPTSWATFHQLVAVTVTFWDSKSILNTHDPAGWPREVLPVYIQHPAPASTKEREATYT